MFLLKTDVLNATPAIAPAAGAGAGATLSVAPPAATTTAKSADLVDDVIHSVGRTMFQQLRQVVDSAKRIPSWFSTLSTEIAALLVALGIIGLVVLILAIVYYAYFTHPRLVWLNRAGDLDLFMTATYFPHVFQNTDAVSAAQSALSGTSQARMPDGSTTSAWSAMNFYFGPSGGCPPVDRIAAVLPIADRDACASLLKRYFGCYSYYKHVSPEASFIEAWFFKLPEDPNLRIEREQWQAINGLRGVLGTFAAATAASNPCERLWMSETDFINSTGSASEVVRNPSATPAARFAASLQSSGASYATYIATSKAAATLVSACLELDLHLNEYVDSLVKRYDSRAIRAFGNPYIFYYFLSGQTHSTADTLRRVWSSDFAQLVPKIMAFLVSGYAAIGKFIDSIPKILRTMGSWEATPAKPKAPAKPKTAAKGKKAKKAKKQKVKKVKAPKKPKPAKKQKAAKPPKAKAAPKPQAKAAPKPQAAPAKAPAAAAPKKKKK